MTSPLHHFVVPLPRERGRKKRLFLPLLAGGVSRRDEGGNRRVIVQGLFAVLLALAFTSPALADDQATLERELGFELPEPYVFVPDEYSPLYIHCNELPGSECPHGDSGHWDISGRIGAPRASELWGSAPDLLGLLAEAGWSVDEESFTAASLDRRDGICRRVVEYQSIFDAASIDLHLYSCEPTQ